MVIMKSLISFFFHLISLKRRRSLKEASHVVIECNGIEKIDGGSITLIGGEPSIGHEGEYCCVCLSRLIEGDDIRRLPCFHMFHKVCVDKWLNLCRKTCPLCRSKVEGDSFHIREEMTEEMVIWFSSFHVAGF